MASACASCGHKPAGCTADKDCPSGQTCKDSACVAGSASTYCDVDADCANPDLVCVTEVHLCTSKHQCDTAAQCQTGQECRDFTGDGYRECGFPGCNSNAECAASLTSCTGVTKPMCVARACVCQQPCAGGCQASKVCCGKTGGACGAAADCCMDDPGPCPATSCQPGFQGTPDQTVAWSVDTCQYPAATCSCQEKPPLPLGVMGDPSAIGLDAQGHLWAAAYNYGPYVLGDPPAQAPYGDLMLGLYNAAHTGFDWRFIDGVPETGVPSGAPSGPRGGVTEPGPDVGKYLDLAVSAAGVVHMVYQDRSALTLKYARVDGSNVVKFTLDPGRETGVYPAVALDPASGAPRVAWLTRRDESGAHPMGFLRFAAAPTATPNAPGDFVQHVLAQVDLTTIPCEGGCAHGKLCPKVTAGNPVCKLSDTNCTPACDTDQSCVAGTCIDLVRGSWLNNEPSGVGVFASMVVKADGKPVVAVFDSVAGVLRIHSTTGTEPPFSATAQFVVTTVATPGQVVGKWPRVAVDATGQVKVAFGNDTTHAVELVTLSATLTVLTREVVDDGSRVVGASQEHHFLAQPALAVRTDGAEVLAYQDGTTGELFMATRSGATFTRTVLAGGAQPYAGTFGFSNDAAARGNQAPVISTFKRNPDPTPPQDALVLFNWP